MDLLRKAISRFFALGYILIKALMKNKGTITNRCILIIQWGNMGDALVDANSILCLTNYYRRQGKEVTVAGTERVKNAIERVLGIDTIDFCCLSEGRLRLSSIKDDISKLRKDGYEIIISILPWSNLPSLYIPACLPCNEVWGAFHERSDKAAVRLIKSALSKYYTNKIMVPIDMQQAQRSKLILHEMGIFDFHTQIFEIPQRDIMLAEEREKEYIVLSVDSMDTARRWPVESFIELSNRLLDSFDYDICLTGSNVDQSTIRTYAKAFAGKTRIKITIGKLSIEEWIELIRGSKFIISLDSGSAHIAASVGTICFCLTGVWDGHRIFPYKIDEKTAGTIEPVCIYRKDAEELPCYGCFSRRRFGWGNRECYDRCNADLPCLCLEKITVDDVMNTIEETVKNGKPVNDI